MEQDKKNFEGKGLYKDKYRDIFSKKLRAGNRNYYFDVKETIHNDYYVVITETKPNREGSALEKHKIFLYKEDFEGFKQMLDAVTTFADKHNAGLEDNTAINDVNTDEIDESIDLEQGWEDLNKIIEKD